MIAKLFIQSNELNHQAIMNFAIQFLMITALFQCMDAIQTIANGALRGYKDTLVPMLFSIGCYLIFGVGSAYFFSFYANLGAIGIWYGILIGIGAAAIIILIRLIQRFKIDNDRAK